MDGLVAGAAAGRKQVGLPGAPREGLSQHEKEVRQSSAVVMREWTGRRRTLTAAVWFLFVHLAFSLAYSPEVLSTEVMAVLALALIERKRRGRGVRSCRRTANHEMKERRTPSS